MSTVNVQTSTATVQSKTFEFHPLAEIFPRIEGKEFQELVSDIKQHGQRETIKLFGGKILDGRNRYEACLQADVEPKFEDVTVSDPMRYVFSLNLHRRQLKESQRAIAAANLVDKSTQICAISQERAATLFNVSLRSVSSALKVLHSGNTPLIDKMQNGEIPVSLAAAVATIDSEQQEKLLKMNKKAMRVAVLGCQAFSKGVAYDGINADQRYAAKKTLGEMKQKAELKELKKSLIASSSKDSSGSSIKQSMNTVSISFTKEEMKMVNASMQESHDKDRVIFIHDLVMAHCEKGRLIEKKLEKRAAAELASCGGTKITDMLGTIETEDDELRALLR